MMTKFPQVAYNMKHGPYVTYRGQHWLQSWAAQNIVAISLWRLPSEPAAQFFGILSPQVKSFSDCVWFLEIEKSHLSHAPVYKRKVQLAKF